MSDRVSLTMPRSRAYFGVAQLVLGGFGLRQNLTLDALDDLQLALGEVLAREHGEGAVTVELSLEGGGVEARIGPFEGAELRSDLEPSDEPRLGLRRVLDSTVDSVEIESRADGEWVCLRKAHAA